MKIGFNNGTFKPIQIELSTEDEKNTLELIFMAAKQELQPKESYVKEWLFIEKFELWVAENMPF